MLVRDKGKLQWVATVESKYYSKCVMIPRQSESDFKFRFYLCSGRIFNGLFAVLCLVIGIFYVHSKFFKLLILTLGFVNVFGILINLVVTRREREGMKQALQSSEARHALYTVLLAERELISGKRYRDFAEDMFKLGETIDCSNYYIAEMVLYEARRLRDLEQHGASVEQYARLDMKKIEGIQLLEALREFLYYCLLYQPGFQQIQELYTKNRVKKIVRLAKIENSRLIAAYEFFVNGDQEKAKLALGKIKFFIHELPFEGVRAMEVERIETLEKIMEEHQKSQSMDGGRTNEKNE